MRVLNAVNQGVAVFYRALEMLSETEYGSLKYFQLSETMAESRQIKKPPNLAAFSAMPARCSSRAALSDEMRALSLLGADEGARQGLRALLREGRRCGFDTVEFAGVSFSSSTAGAGAVHLQSGNDGRQQASGARRPRRKSDERRERDAERFREKRMRKKLFAVLPLINAVMKNAAAAEGSTAAAETADGSWPARSKAQ